MKTLKEIDRQINEFWDKNQHLFQERLDELAQADELMVQCDLSPHDPLHLAEIDRINEKYAHVTVPYTRMYWEKNALLVAGGYSLKVRRDEARSMVDAEHPRAYYEGAPRAKEGDDWSKRKQMFYGPGGKLLDEDKKIILIPGVEHSNRASSLM